MTIASVQQRSLQEKLGLLRETDLFAGLSDDDIMAIGHATTMSTCKAGQRILSPDDPSDRIHILKKGKVRVYRVTPDGATAMIGRTLSEEGAAALRARFLVSNPQTPQEMLTAALGTTAPVDLGRGLTLTRRRVAGDPKAEQLAR